jgi:type VI secretion system secreted protein Hcp
MRIGLTRRMMVWCGAASMLLPAVSAVAAVDAYMIVVGAKQGAIKSDVVRPGTPAGAIHLTSVVKETPAATGATSGKRQHSVITITKEIDKASPLLAQALNSNETMKTVQIVFAGSGAGAGKVAQKIELTNATILSIRKAGNTEEIKLTYESIEVTYTNGGKTAMDDWNAPI